MDDNKRYMHNKNWKIETIQNNEYNTNTQARLCNYFCSGKTISNAYYVCAFVALVIQQAKLMRHIILSSASCRSLSNFPTLPHKFYDLKKSY